LKEGDLLALTGEGGRRGRTGKDRRVLKKSHDSAGSKGERGGVKNAKGGDHKTQKKERGMNWVKLQKPTRTGAGESGWGGPLGTQKEGNTSNRDPEREKKTKRLRS